MLGKESLLSVLRTWAIEQNRISLTRNVLSTNSNSLDFSHIRSISVRVASYTAGRPCTVMSLSCAKSVFFISPSFGPTSLSLEEDGAEGGRTHSPVLTSVQRLLSTHRDWCTTPVPRDLFTSTNVYVWWPIAHALHEVIAEQSACSSSIVAILPPWRDYNTNHHFHMNGK